MLSHPPIVPEEALPSYNARLGRFNGLTQREANSLGMGRGRWSSVDWTLPRDVARFASCFGEPLGRTDPQYWLYGHTLAPYFGSTLAPVRRQAFEGRLLTASGGPRRPVLPVSIEEWLSGPPLICLECERAFMEQRGYSVILRQWLIPFSTRCSDHGVLLRRAGSWTPLGAEKLSKAVVLDCRSENTLVLIDSVENLLVGRRDQLAELGELLQSRGFLTLKGRIRRKELVALLVKYGRGRYEHPELDSLLGSQAKVEALLAPLWYRRSTLQPTIAAILINALNDTSPTPQPSLWEEARCVRTPELDAALIAGQRATQAAKAFGIAVQTAIQRAAELGLFINRRPKSLTPELSELVIHRLAEGASIGSVATAAGLSQATVYRILSSSKDLKAKRAKHLGEAELKRRRTKLLAVIERNPLKGAKALRSMAPADYAFLYRNDRPWLMSVMPAPVRRQKSKAPRSRTPEGADEALAARLEAATKTVNDGPTRKQTTTGLLQVAGRSFGRPLGDSFPRTQAALDVATESLRTYVFRRLLWTIRQIRREGRRAPDWVVRRESGIRAELIQASGVDVQEVIARARVIAIEEVLDEARLTNVPSA